MKKTLENVVNKGKEVVKKTCRFVKDNAVKLGVMTTLAFGGYFVDKANAENTKKRYSAIVQAEKAIDKRDFEDKLTLAKNIMENKKVYQQTPNRVSHRRADIIREKFIYTLDGEYINSNLFKLMIETQGGTYIKELINGDNGRTKPSFSEIFGITLICKELDVLDIND